MKLAERALIVSINADPRFSIYNGHGGGQGKFVRYISKYLRNRAYEVTIITSSSGTTGKEPAYGLQDYNLIDLGDAREVHVSHDTSSIGTMSKRLSENRGFRENYDLTIICHYLSWECVKNHLTNNTVVISSLCSTGLEKGDLDIRSKHRLILESQLLERSNVVIASSRNEFALLKDHYQVATEKLSLIPRPHPFKTNQMQRKILFAARATPQKGLDILLEAIKYTQADCLFLMAGFELSEVQLNFPKHLELFKELHKSARIQVLGPLESDALLGLLCQVESVCIPSRYETFGNLAIESLAVGTPIICSNVGALTEHVNDSGLGKLFQSEDPVALSKTIELSLKENEASWKAKSMGVTYSLNFSEETISRKYDDLLSTVRRKSTKNSTLL